MQTSDKSYILKKYILLKIWSKEWEPGKKINSIQELAIKFNLTNNVVKKVLLNFINTNILKTKQKIGYFVNEQIFDYIPLSIRGRYNLELADFQVKKTSNQDIIVKTYVNSEKKVQIWVESSLSKNIVFDLELIKKHNFMWNLAYRGVVISKIISKKETKKINGEWYTIENRELYSVDDVLIANEKIYILTEIWKEKYQLSL